MTETAPSFTCLLLEDSDLDSELLELALRRELGKVSLRRVTGEQAFAAALAQGGFDLILSDYSLPGFDGIRALDMARDAASDVPFIFVSGVLGEEIAIETLRRGATDYVLKHRLAQLPTAVRRALAEAEARHQRNAAEQMQRLLVAELSHRVKNMLATVQSIASQTIEGCDSLETFRERFNGRLIALAEAHGLIFANDWQRTNLADIAQRVLTPFGERGRHWQATGPALTLPPKAALAVALMLHELGANAVRHGALSTAAGRITLTWSVQSDDAAPAHNALLNWREHGGPEVREPTRRGFGTKLLQRGARHELDGSATLEYRPEGLQVRIAFPVPA